MLEPHRDRVTWDAPIHSVADIDSLDWKPKSVDVKPSRIGGLEELLSTYEYCEREGIAPTAAGRPSRGRPRPHPVPGGADPPPHAERRRARTATTMPRSRRTCRARSTRCRRTGFGLG